ncbi:MAG: secretory protein [Flavisolibacter sp.]|jgi:hypothetical protein|nr:secretory protein [Flavisolibacter sp.]
MQTRVKLIFIAIISFISYAAAAQTDTAFYNKTYPAIVSNKAAKETYPILSIDTITKKKYMLVFVNRSATFPDSTKQKLINTFFKVYPKEAKAYNKKAMKKVVFTIEPGYSGVAAANNGRIFYSPAWFAKNPQDIDVVTHECMHIVQSYGGGSGPGWITEGIADYVRYKMGVNNEAANWKMPDYSAKQNFNNSYRITARFFVWIEKKYDKKFVRKLDKAMREKAYTATFVKEHTSKTFEELWAEYGANPSI